MKAFLMFRDRDFDLGHSLPPNADDLVRDLQLETLFKAMSRGDEFVHEVEKVALLTAVRSKTEEIEYRQWIMADSLNNPEIVRALYDLAVEALTREREATFFTFYRDSPGLLLHRSAAVLSVFIDILHRLRRVADSSTTKFRSEGFQKLFITLERELTDDYFAELYRHLSLLKFPLGVLMTARLGAGNKGTDYALRDPPCDYRPWLLRHLIPYKRAGHILTVHPRDEAGAQALSELRNRGLALTARALAQAVDHLLSFFQMLRAELAFYIGGLNLREALVRLQAPTAFPHARSSQVTRFNARGLFDVCLVLSQSKAAVGNDIAADDKRLIIITGANQGGKSTFLRGAGVAQLMMQAGLFVGAEGFEANIVDGIFTHYKREEDCGMVSGKFDEELKRMDSLADALDSNSLVLFNESFASTNEREGSEIAEQIALALAETGKKIIFVTHLYQFASAVHALNRKDTLFLRAERHESGARTYKLIEGTPLETSFGADIYSKVFGDDLV